MAQFEVEKFGRADKGEWFGFGARRFADEAKARAYFEAFAREQAAVLSNGIRIDLRVRAGRRVLATVGGRLGAVEARQIRELATVAVAVPS